MLALRGRLTSFLTGRIAVRHLGLTPTLQASDSEQAFEDAKKKLDTLSEDPGNEKKLKMYALFKQATLGKNTTDEPGAFNFVAKAKWSAWHDLGEMTQDDAKQAYADIVADLAKKEGK